MDGLILKNGIIITPFKELRDRILFIKKGKIEKIVKKGEYLSYPKVYLRNYGEIDVGGNFISPGFIDIHTHGGNDVDVVDDYLGPLCELKAKHGTTCYLPTIWTSYFDKMVRACIKINNHIINKKNVGKSSKILGINLEGPYLNPELGGQKKELVKIPIFEEYEKLVNACGGKLKIMTLSPELNGSIDLIRFLRERNIIVSIGHSDLKIEKLHDILDLGIDLVTHILNAFGDSICDEPGTKALGIQEELLICDNLMSEVICDKNGVLVKPTWLKILIKCKGLENIILITDSMKVAGMPPGRYKLQDGRFAFLEEEDDLLRLEDGGLIGTTLTLDNSVKNFINHTGSCIKDAARLASYNPAKVLGISNKKGEIKTGLDADIIVFDSDINIKMTIIEGSVIFNDLKNYK